MKKLVILPIIIGSILIIILVVCANINKKTLNKFNNVNETMNKAINENINNTNAEILNNNETINTNETIINDQEIVNEDIKNNSSEEDYTCEVGYVLENKECKKIENINPTVTYSCTSGTLKNNLCYLNYVQAIKTCTTGYSYKVVLDTCVNNSNEFDEVDPIGYGCESNEYKLTNENGIYLCYEVTNAKETYSCPDGYTLNNNLCMKTETKAATKK